MIGTKSNAKIKFRKKKFKIKFSDICNSKARMELNVITGAFRKSNTKRPFRPLNRKISFSKVLFAKRFSIEIAHLQIVRVLNELCVGSYQIRIQPVRGGPVDQIRCDVADFNV